MASQENQDSQDFAEEKPLKARYTKTSLKKKEQLIDLVINLNYSIYRASKKLKISNSTAKAVLRNYEKLGIILQRNSKSSVQKVLEKPISESLEKEFSAVVEEIVSIKREEIAKEAVAEEKTITPPVQSHLNYHPESYPFLQYPYQFYYTAFMP